MQRIVHSIANVFAVAGGLVLTGLIALTCLSVLGRSLNTFLHGPVEKIFPELAAALLALGIGPINGDFELVEAGMAFSIFAFLPICQLRNGHAVVELFLSGWPKKFQDIWQLGINLIFALVLTLLAYQLLQGMLSKRAYGETTFLLQFPIWWSYAASLIAAAVATLVAIYVVIAEAIDLASAKRSYEPL